jgi:hypothetical protein
VSTIDELLGRKSSGFDKENLNYGLGDLPLKLAQISPTGGGRSVGTVRSCSYY